MNALPCRVLAALVLALAVTGCANRLPERYEVVVSVPCKVDKPKQPAWASEALPKGAGIFDQVKALLAERRQRQGYEKQLEAAVDGCQP